MKIVILVPFHWWFYKPSNCVLKFAAAGTVNPFPRLWLPIRFPTMLLNARATKNLHCSGKDLPHMQKETTKLSDSGAVLLLPSFNYVRIIAPLLWSKDF